MRPRPALLASPVVLAVVLTGCSGGVTDRGDGIPMVPYRDRVAAGGSQGDRADAVEDAREDLEECGDPDDSRTFEVSASGAQVELHVPADADDDPVEELEDYRGDVGASPVCWVVAEVDDSDGDQVVDLPRVEVVTSDGQAVTLQRASDVVRGWADLRPDDEDLAARGVELITRTGGVVGPGEEGEVVLVADVDLDDARAASVQLTEGGALVDAHD
ncbi:hypothetical protein WDZ17_08015 [Pseudokineococcus basanitobsidens]|uniref:Uncharacterized protein n=1 Tax=Pseudokineococcus basanitobsidens TaxID=1926649 RepID=A0ABU8RJN0_9ACTN